MVLSRRSVIVVFLAAQFVFHIHPHLTSKTTKCTCVHMQHDSFVTACMLQGEKKHNKRNTSCLFNRHTRLVCVFPPHPTSPSTTTHPHTMSSHTSCCRSASCRAISSSMGSSKNLLTDTSSLMPLRRRVFTMNSRARACAGAGSSGRSTMLLWWW